MLNYIVNVVKPTQAVTSIEQSPLFKEHTFLS
jgi:hypothetical protein